MTPENRAWEVVRRAFEERTPAPRPRARARLAVALAVGLVAVVVVAALSPPGHAVFERVRKAVGVEHAAPALFSLPGGGRLLVVANGEAVVVEPDGAKRPLGAYTDAQWSPHGLYIVATRPGALVALTPSGTVRWTLARRDPRNPRWEGTRTDTRIAYASGGTLRVVAGDGTGDRLLDAHGGSLPPAWDPARLHTLAYVARGDVVLRTAGGTLVWRRALPASGLAWSSDGRYLAVLSNGRVVVLSGRDGKPVRTVSMLGARVTAAAFAPGSHRLAVSVEQSGRSQLHVVDLDRPGHGKLVLAGPGRFGDLAWSPGGGWLLVSWPAADQWVFLHGSAAHAVGNIRAQFPGAAELSGRWCCSR